MKSKGKQFLLTNAEIKKNQILEATFHCIYEQGIAGMSTRSIAKKAGVFQANLQYYFKSKEKLLREFMEILFDRMIFDVQRRFEKADPPEKKLECIMEAGRDFATRQREMFIVFISCWSLCSRNPSLRRSLSRLYLRFLNVFNEVLEEGEKRGLFNKVKKETISVFIISFVQGLSLLRWNMPQKSFRVNEHYEMFADSLRSLIIKKEVS